MRVSLKPLLSAIVFLFAAAIGVVAQRPELFVQTGHSKAVLGLAFGLDGTILVSASDDGTIRIWDAASGRELRKITQPGSSFNKVALSQDEKTIATQDRGDTVRLWNVVTGKQFGTIKRDTGFFELAFSADGRTLAGADSNEVFVFDVATAAKVRSFMVEELESDNTAIAFSQDGRLLAKAEHLPGERTESVVQIYDVNTGRQLQKIRIADDLQLTLTQKFGIDGLAFSSDNKMIASGDRIATKIWDIATGQQLDEIRKPGYPLAFSRDNGTLAMGDVGSISLWDIKRRRELFALDAPQIYVRPLAFSGDGKKIAAAAKGGDGTILMWDVSSGHYLHTLGGHAYGTSLSLNANGMVIARPAGEEVFTVWDVAYGRSLHSFSWYSGSASYSTMTSGLAFSEDGNKAATVNGNKVRLWDVGSGHRIRTITDDEQVGQVALSPDGQTLVTGHLKSDLTLWNAGTGERLKTFDAGVPAALAFTDGGKVLINVSVTGTKVGHGAIQTVDITSGREERFNFPLAKLPEGDMGFVMAAAIRPNGKMAAVAETWRTTISLFDIPSAQKKLDLPDRDSFDDIKTSLAFSSDGRFLAGGSGSGVVALWDVDAGRKKWTMNGHSDAVDRLSFSADSKILASVGKDAVIKLWDVATGKELIDVVAANDQDWLAVTPDGIFDGASASWNQILWRFNNNTFDLAPVEAFFNEFYYPNLLNEILDGKRPRATADILQKDRSQPQLNLIFAAERSNPNNKTPAEQISAPKKTSTETSEEDLARLWRRIKAQASVKRAGPPGAISVKERYITVEIHILETGAGAQDVRLFRNSSLVKVWRGDVLKGEKSVTLEATIPIVAGENRLTAYAFNHDNIKSSDTTLTVNGAESLKRKAVAYILSVGVNQYANSQYNLKYAVADAQDFAEELKRQQAKLSSYQRVEVVSLNDRDATKANLLKSLTDLAAKIQPEDALVIYFAGHGTAQQNRFYLIPHDLGYAGSRTELDPSGLQNILAHSISDEELERAVEGIDAGQLLLVIDACNSGQALEAEEKRRGPMNSKGLAQLAYEKGMYILTAAQSYQAAQEAARLGHGYLTYALVEEGLKTNAADLAPKDGQVLLREWLDFATARVPQMQQEKIEEQQKQGRQLEQVIKFAEADAGAERRVQRPRVFYRREAEVSPLVVARP